MSPRLKIAFFIAALAAPALTHASLILTIDANTETLFLSGSDSGDLAMVDFGTFL